MSKKSGLPRSLSRASATIRRNELARQATRRGDVRPLWRVGRVCRFWSQTRGPPAKHTLVRVVLSNLSGTRGRKQPENV